MRCSMAAASGGPTPDTHRVHHSTNMKEANKAPWVQLPLAGQPVPNLPGPARPRPRTYAHRPEHLPGHELPKTWQSAAHAVFSRASTSTSAPPARRRSPSASRWTASPRDVRPSWASSGFLGRQGSFQPGTRWIRWGILPEGQSGHGSDDGQFRRGAGSRKGSSARYRPNIGQALVRHWSGIW